MDSKRAAAKLFFCIGTACLGAAGANAQNGAFTDIDVNRDPADANFLTLALSNQVQADRIYDEISGRILDRFVRGEVGDLFTPLSPGRAPDRFENAQLQSDRVLSGYLSQTYDNLEFGVAGRDLAADFNNLWIGADALLDERILVGFTASHQSFEAQGGYSDQVSAGVDTVAFFEPVFFEGVDQIRLTADSLNYRADYDIGTASEDIEGWLGVAYAAMEVIPNRMLVSGFLSYADNDREASLSGSVVEVLDKNILPDFQPLVDSQQITTDFRENRYTFQRREENSQTAWNASLTATIFTDLSENINGAVSVGAQYVGIDVGDANVTDSFSGSFAVTPDFGIGFEDPESFQRSASLPSDLEEEFAIFRAEAMVSYRPEQSIFVPFARFSVRHYSEQLNFRSSQWDTFNFTFQEFGTGVEGTATTPNTLQSRPSFDQTFGTLELGTTIALTPRVRARINALSEVISNDLDRWGLGVSLQRRF